MRLTKLELRQTWAIAQHILYKLNFEKINFSSNQNLFCFFAKVLKQADDCFFSPKSDHDNPIIFLLQLSDRPQDIFIVDPRAGTR